MKISNIASISFVRDCLERTDEKGKKEIIDYLSRLDDSISPELAKDLLNLPHALTETSLKSFLERSCLNLI